MAVVARHIVGDSDEEFDALAGGALNDANVIFDYEMATASAVVSVVDVEGLALLTLPAVFSLPNTPAHYYQHL